LAEAQFEIGQRFARGKGVPRSDTEAAKWFYMAANKGLSEAQITLGLAFGKGLGVPADPTEAARWFRKAAEQGDQHGQYQIGVVLRDGRGVPRDQVEAHMWFNLAAAQGHSGAKQNMEMLAEFMPRIAVMRAERMAVNRWRASQPTKEPPVEKATVKETTGKPGAEMTARSEDGE
jgi:TPR repeat protein